MILRVETEDQDRFFQVDIIRVTETQIMAEGAIEPLTFTKEAGKKVTFNFLTSTGKTMRDSVVWR